MQKEKRDKHKVKLKPADISEPSPEVEDPWVVGNESLPPITERLRGEVVIGVM